MIRFILRLSFFLFFTTESYSQGINNLWLMGKDSDVGLPFGGTKMDFSSGSLNMSWEDRKININCTNGLISNSLGQLLFVSNGIFIQNAANDTMLNGSGLNPSVFTTIRFDYGLTIPQANLVIPIPGDTSKYYLFHETADDYFNTFCPLYLYYSIVDMELYGGLGGVTQKNTVLLHDTLVAGRLTACKHGNGRDWWLIVHQYNTDLYYKFLITPYGIRTPSVQNIGSIRNNSIGQCVFSPDGRLFAYYEPNGDLDIFDFDRCTGDFTMKAHVDINDSAHGGGVAFSANSRMLYVSSTSYVYQFEMLSADIAASQITVAVYDGYFSPQPPFATTFYLSQLAPDGKIYINCSNGTFDLHVINYPDSLGLACMPCQHCIHLPAYNSFTMPNYPNYFLGEENGSICDSLQTEVLEISSMKYNLRISPNPVTGGEITLNYPVMSSSSELKVYSIEGKQVAESILPPWSSIQTLNLPMLPSGLYMVDIRNNETHLKSKFIKE